jgi:phosphoglycerol geranylgeranyltransferase
MQEGKIYKKLMSEISKQGALAFIQFDPPKYTKESAARLAKMAEAAGVDAFAVGGSVGAQGEILDSSIKTLKENCSIPIILFPGNIATVSKHADAIYFMSMLNSNDPYYITGAQIASAWPIKNLGLEVIPTSYIIVEPGRAVGWVGRAQMIPRDLPYLAGITALAGQYMGSKLAILESGGGAPSPAPPEMIKTTKAMIDIPLIVAGGVRTDAYAYETIKAGADILHFGTAVENEKSPDAAKAKIESIVKAVKKAGKERR